MGQSNKNQYILLVGACGTGKTWVMKKLIDKLGASEKYKLGRIAYRSNGRTNILGKYDGSTFEGSDKLSMAAMADFEDYLYYTKSKTTIAEGDRFTNSTFLNKAQPIVIKILGDGKEGREKRGSQQTERQIKSIATRVKNIEAHIHVENSQQALETILKLLEDESN